MKFSSRIVTIDRTPVFLGGNTLAKIDHVIRSMHLGRDGIYILTDNNTRSHCLPAAIAGSACLAGAGILEVEAGEGSKTLLAAEKLWGDLLASGAGREALLVNLGGGVISDLGGFVSAGYKRGISYINIPTSLIGQADAAIGGKTAVNTGQVKNQVGFFHAPKAVFIFPGFLESLPLDHLRSGFAEIIKTALIGNGKLWRRLCSRPVAVVLSIPTGHPFWQELIGEAVQFKNRMVVQDYREQKIRKVLNFGHTIGHALESYSFTGSRSHMLHGDAVAWGMICAASLSTLKTGLTVAGFMEIKAYLAAGFPPPQVESGAMPLLMEFMRHDKKRHNNQVQFTLISNPGEPVIGVPCTEEEIMGAMELLFSP